jgi:hypothetical protein
VVDIGLAQHAVVLELGLAQGRSVAGDDDELGLAGAQRLKSALVAEGDLARLRRGQLRLNNDNEVCRLTFITSARRELMLLASFLDFLGAIVTLSTGVE